MCLLRTFALWDVPPSIALQPCLHMRHQDSPLVDRHTN